MGMEMSPKAIVIVAIGAVVVLSFILGLTGFIKSEQSEDTASTSAQKQDQMTNEFDEYRSIVKRVLEMEEQAFKDKEKVLNLTVNVSSEIRAVKILHSELIENVKLLQERTLNFPKELDSLKNETSYAFAEIGEDVNSINETIDELHLSLNTTKEEFNIEINKTVNTLKVEVRKTVESVNIVATNVETVEENLKATEEHFKEYKANLANESDQLNSSIKSLEERTDSLDDSGSAEFMTSFASDAVSASLTGGSGDNESAGAEEATTAAFVPTTAAFVPTTEEIETTDVVQMTTTAVNASAVMSLLRADMATNRQSMETAEETLVDFRNGKYKKNFDEIAIATGRVENKIGDLWRHGLNGYLYQKTSAKQNWNAADTSCKNDGGELAHKGIRDFTVRWRLANAIISDDTEPYWIGLSYSSSQGTWKWADDTDAGENAIWADGEPSQSSNGCGVIQGGDLKYKTSDVACSQSYLSLCEKKCC